MSQQLTYRNIWQEKRCGSCTFAKSDRSQWPICIEPRCSTLFKLWKLSF
jgi:hypothetical protein